MDDGKEHIFRNMCTPFSYTVQCSCFVVRSTFVFNCVVAKVKQTAELNVGVLTQCLKSRTLQRMNPATCSNILLKVNSKLNGVNHTFAPVSR
jgi:hypothetical protein